MMLFVTAMKKRPLYAAMRKYGIENFIVETLEETDNPNEREMYWINQKNTYHNGYNVTLGGDGAKYVDENAVIEAYYRLQYQDKVHEELGVDVSTIHKILTNNNIPIIIHKNGAKHIAAYDLTDSYVASFETIRDAARWIIKNNLTGSTDDRRVASNIGRAVDQRKRKTAFGYIWKSE